MMNILALSVLKNLDEIFENPVKMPYSPPPPPKAGPVSTYLIIRVHLFNAFKRQIRQMDIATIITDKCNNCYVSKKCIHVSIFCAPVYVEQTLVSILFYLFIRITSDRRLLLLNLHGGARSQQQCDKIILNTKSTDTFCTLFYCLPPTEHFLKV